METPKEITASPNQGLEENEMDHSVHYGYLHLAVKLDGMTIEDAIAYLKTVRQDFRGRLEIVKEEDDLVILLPEGIKQ